jgi:hypothetical protein
MTNKDLKTVRQFQFHVVYHEGLDATQLFIGDLPCLTMKGEHGVELLALEYMSSHEWYDALQVFSDANPEYEYSSLQECIKYIRSLPTDTYGMAKLPEVLK